MTPSPPSQRPMALPGPALARFWNHAGMSMSLRLGMLSLFALVVLLSRCDAFTPGALSTSPDVASADMVQRLQGTWEREAGEQGIHARRLLTLRPDGSFLETVHVVDDVGASTDFVHEGTWLFDGTNLKRHYTRMNGKPPSRLNLPFATFEIRFVSRNEFLGLDRVHGNQVQYRRVAAEAQP
jgi:hypothetical protein